MTASPRVALVINTYDQPEYLARVLKAVSGQSSMADEVLLADDGSGEATRQVFARWQAEGLARSQHVWHKHEGFRRARILNEAIAGAQSDCVVFLDGDTIPHSRFVSDHRQLARKNSFIQGHRTLIKQPAAAWFGLSSFKRDRRRALWTGQFEGIKYIWRWPRPLLRARTDLRGIRGCNLCVWREDLLKVNGYNEAFVGWGREDSELAVRLMNHGVKRLDVRGWALCYHLWHPPATRESLPANDDLLAETQRKGATKCEAGLDRLRISK